jgi:hypothetical protein
MGFARVTYVDPPPLLPLHSLWYIFALRRGRTCLDCEVLRLLRPPRERSFCSTSTVVRMNTTTQSLCLRARRRSSQFLLQSYRLLCSRIFSCRHRALTQSSSSSPRPGRAIVATSPVWRSIFCGVRLGSSSWGVTGRGNRTAHPLLLNQLTADQTPDERREATEV